jgi:exodeoxyribonuclease VII large subunit
LNERRVRLFRAIRARLDQSVAERARLAHALGDPRLGVASAQQKLDWLVARLTSVHPRAVIDRNRAALGSLAARLVASTRARLEVNRRVLESSGARLDALSPLSVLGRGYAIATRADGRALRSSSEVRPGEPIDVRLHEGSVVATVTARRS